MVYAEPKAEKVGAIVLTGLAPVRDGSAIKRKRASGGCLGTERR
jgi:hypothetical protein